MPEALPLWVDGRVVPRAEARAAPLDSARLEGLGHYTTARVRRGAVLWVERHVDRLQRDARRLGLPRVDERAVHTAFAELAPAAFGSGDGAIRLQHARDDDGGRSHWLGIARPLGDDPPTWRAVRAPFPHEGPQPWSGAKTTSRLACTLAQRAAHARGAEEALFADGAGRLIEGSRTNLFAVLADGRWVTPDLARGGVAGLARAAVLEATDAFAVRDVPFHALAGARELIAVNALRGARPVALLDGHPIGTTSGPGLAHLAALLDLDAAPTAAEAAEATVERGAARRG